LLTGGAVLTAHPGLSFAVSVLSVCLAAGVAAAGARRGSRRGLLDAAATAAAVLITPVVLAAGLGYWLAFGCVLALALMLTAWAAISASRASARAAVLGTVLTLAWSLAAPAPTLIALGTFSVAYLIAARRADRAVSHAIFTCLAVLAIAALTAAALLATGGSAWLAIAGALTVAGVLTIARAITVREAPTVDEALTVGEAPTVAGRLSLDRISALGLVLLEAAWCAWLRTWGVTTIEAYTLPAAAIAIGFGWQTSRQRPELNSWAAYGPGLGLMLLPSLIAAWAGYGWLRPALLAVAAAGVAVVGARLRLRAPLLTGVAVAGLDAGHQLAPEVRQLAAILPGWVPVAVAGAVLLWAGATYEARLRNLATLRSALAGLR
jgi:hypothetical protein